MPRGNRRKKDCNRNDNALPSGSNQPSNTSQLVENGMPTSRSQRDLLIDLLNSSKASCVICCDQIKRIQQIWHCRKCYQIIHLKCIKSWYRESHITTTWRCPLCQHMSEKKPIYSCFCGDVLNPFPKKVGTPHSCGQICGLQKKHPNAEYDDCYHVCTLKCHPGPCPQCPMKVLKKCCCGKIRSRFQCGVPLLCQNTCSKELDCEIHNCEKRCHVGECAPCDKHGIDFDRTDPPPRPRDYMLMLAWLYRLFYDSNRNVD